MCSLEDIPPTLHKALFPTPRCTVSQLLLFQFPIRSALQMVMAFSLSEFWSLQSPIILDMAHISELRSLPIPPSVMLDKLVAEKNYSTATSIFYAHLPRSSQSGIRS